MEKQTAGRNNLGDLAPKEAAEIVTHLAFYAGWPKAWSAFSLIKEVYEDE